MPINDIVEINNDTMPDIEPVREIMEITIPNITVDNIPKSNGFVYLAIGSGGSGKSSMILSFFKKRIYRGVFDNIFYFCPEVSFSSVKNHPFKNATEKDNVFIQHELTTEALQQIYNVLDEKKRKYVEYQKNKKKKNRKSKKEPFFEDEDQIQEEEEEIPELEYSCLFIDDMAAYMFKHEELKTILNKIVSKTRHLCLAVIITLQELKYFPLNLRKQITNLSIFKPKNYEDWANLCKEYFNMNKEDSLKLYNYVFDKPYTHLDVQTNNGSTKYYKNWNLLNFS